MKKLKLVLSQTQAAYGDNVYLPLAVGCLWAHARQFPEIREAWDKPIFLYKKEPLDKAMERIGDPPDVAAFSCYIWNWEWNKAAAALIKTYNPKTTIVFGGVHIPDKSSEKWWREHNYVDFLIHGEGEQPFADFLREYVGNRDWSKVAGLTSREFQNERKFAPLEKLTSPYLDGTFDKLLPLERRFQTLQETNRGCPY